MFSPSVIARRLTFHKRTTNLTPEERQREKKNQRDIPQERARPFLDRIQRRQHILNIGSWIMGNEVKLGSLLDRSLCCGSPTRDMISNNSLALAIRIREYSKLSANPFYNLLARRGYGVIDPCERLPVNDYPREFPQGVPMIFCLAGMYVQAIQQGHLEVRGGDYPGESKEGKLIIHAKPFYHLLGYHPLKLSGPVLTAMKTFEKDFKTPFRMILERLPTRPHSLHKLLGIFIDTHQAKYKNKGLLFFPLSSVIVNKNIFLK